MSGEDNFLARWSRRKREAGEAETDLALPPSLPAGEEPGGERGMQALSPGPSPIGGAGQTEPPETCEPTEPLPRIEDLTADSDLSAFLRKGVPEALKAAALRRMWSLDPAIRDFVGPAEYAYDFNDPASIPGFGIVTPPASPAALDPSAPRFSSPMSQSGPESDPAVGQAAAGDTPAAAGNELRIAKPEEAGPSSASPESPREDRTQDVATLSPEVALDTPSKGSSKEAEPPSREQHGTAARRRHGGAAPR